VPDVFTIAHICTYRGLKNPIFVLVPRLVGCGRPERKRSSDDGGLIDDYAFDTEEGKKNDSENRDGAIEIRLVALQGGQSARRHDELTGRCGMALPVCRDW
jgi:hypothetical protein